MTKRSKITKKPIPVPQSDAECRSAIREIGELKRRGLRLKADLDDQVGKLQEQFGASVAPIDARVAELEKGVEMFAEANRQRLTRDGKVKFHKFETGLISWRTRPAKVTIRGKETVIEALKSLGLRRFLRVKEDVNKEAMLANDKERAIAAAVDGVSIGSEGEDFEIEPFETETSGSVA